eukprot:Nk52_evm50s2192 gene=Nk52_evmTU50s2192
MVKLFAISIFHKSGGKAKLLSVEEDLSSFGFFQRSSVAEFINFYSKTLAERTQPGQRQTVVENEHHCHAFVSNDNLAGVIIADKEYPVRVAFSFLNKAIDDFQTKYPRNIFTNPSVKPKDVPFPELKTMFQTYQDPAKADGLCRVQNELDETKIVLHKTIEGVLDRGEKIENLVDKSEDLSRQSKMFYKQAKKTNSCCAQW